MFEYNIASRSHFTTLDDGRSTFNHWIKTMHIQDEMPPFEYEQGMTSRGKRIVFKVDSWGGYVDASGRWVIFVAWRAASIKVTKYSRWFWDENQLKCYGRVDIEFVN